MRFFRTVAKERVCFFFFVEDDDLDDSAPTRGAAARIHLVKKKTFRARLRVSFAYRSRS